MWTWADKERHAEEGDALVCVLFEVCQECVRVAGRMTSLSTLAGDRFPMFDLQMRHCVSFSVYRLLKTQNHYMSRSRLCVGKNKSKQSPKIMHRK